VGLRLYFGFMFVFFFVSPCGVVLVLLMYAIAVAACGVMFVLSL
jgi:hypothetical protein